MYKDFIVKQTSDYDSQFKPRTLIGNWYEQRCNPSHESNTFYRERKIDLTNPTVLHDQPFQRTTQNWANFQPYQPVQTFNTEYRDNYKDSENQKRLSVLNPFITKKSEFDKNQEALEEYREKWTKSKHVYDQSRTYLGAKKN